MSMQPILSSGIRKRLMTALDRRNARIFTDEFYRVMQGILTEDGMIAGEAIHWDPNDPGSTGGTTGGDLGGGLPTPRVVGIQGTPVSNTIPTIGQVLTFDGMKYVPTSGLAAGNRYRTRVYVHVAGPNFEDIRDMNGDPVEVLRTLET
jgi:hypothetical protein